MLLHSTNLTGISDYPTNYESDSMFVTNTLASKAVLLSALMYVKSFLFLNPNAMGNYSKVRSNLGGCIPLEL